MNSRSRMSMGAPDNRGLADCHSQLSGEAVDQLQTRRVLLPIVGGIILGRVFLSTTSLHNLICIFFCLLAHIV